MALGCLLTACLPFEATDPRVGSYMGSFENGETRPLLIRFDVLPTGEVSFATALESYVEGGSTLPRLSGGSRDLNFENQRTSQGKTASYRVNAKLLPGDQVIEGTMSYWTELDGNLRAYGPPNIPFRVRRTQRSVGYVQTTPGDFSCTSLVIPVPPGVSFNPPEDAGIPQPSCFTGDLVARTLMPLGTARFMIYGQTGGGFSGRSLAIFSACDGRELACKYVDPADAALGGNPFRHAIGLDLKQFEEIVVVSEGLQNGMDVFWCAEPPEREALCWPPQR